MVEFNTAYYSPMDRKYHESVELEREQPSKIEEPIIPMIELGTTMLETEGKFRNMIQNAQAQIRRGAGKIQMMLTETGEMGGRPKAYGPEVRAAMRDVFKASETMLVGVEMPTRSLNNLSGFDGKKINPELQRNNLDEIRDAIKFTADVAQGGGVDLVSFEFPRAIFDADWNKTDPKTGKKLFEESREKFISIVDDRTGAIQSISIREIERIPMSTDLETGKPFEYDFETNSFVIKEGDKVIKSLPSLPTNTWEDIASFANKQGKNPAIFILDEFKNKELREVEANTAHARGQAAHYWEQVKAANAFIQDPSKPAEQKETVKKQLADAKNMFSYYEKAIEQGQIKLHEIEEVAKHRKLLNEFGKESSIKGYAEAGAMAFLETHNNKFAERPVSVGPELGWPDYFGGHPAEFTELIKKSRERLVTLLTSKTVDGEANPYFQPGMSERDAQEEAKKHIKGCFDTSHMGMWLKHFRPDLPWEERVKEFNKWYMDEIKQLAKDDTVGSIQLVNSMSAAHGHNPPGQGIFPVVDAAKEFKKQGFTGHMVSEGHEEEKFEEGRILVETWRAFNSPFESKYGPGSAPRGFRDVQSGYVGRQYAPRQMFGSYTPPFGEYKPWSEIPFE